MQSINIGDQVSFINETLAGEVTSIKANGLIGVTIEDDFELDVKASDLVVTHSTVKRVADKINIAPQEQTNLPKPELGTKPALYWYMTDGKEGYNLHLANLRDSPFLFVCYRQGNINLELIAEGKIEPGEYKKMMLLVGKDTAKWGSFIVQFLAIRNLPAVIPDPLQGKLVLESHTLNQPTAMKEGKPYWLLPINLVKIKPTVEKETEAPISIEPILYNPTKPYDIIDLHAETNELMALEPDLILKKQMEIFYYNLELAIAYKMPKIVFIHGVGTGVLKNLISLAVKGNKHVALATAAPFTMYGEGAMEIRLRG